MNVPHQSRYPDGFKMLLALLALPISVFAPSALAQSPTPNVMPSKKPCNVEAKFLATVKSRYTVPRTVQRLEKAIQARDLGIFATIDHAANAANVDLRLRPTTLIIFGNPKAGTLLMQSEQSIGIDLPLKYLVWRDDCGTVRIGYNKAKFLKRRHNITDQDPVFNNIATTLDAIAREAAGGDEAKP